MTTTYVICPANDSGKMIATVYPTREAATAAASQNDYVIAGPGDVIFIGSTLVEVYNALTGKAVKKFESREAGVRRLLSALAEVATNPSVTTETKPANTDQEKNMSDSETKRRGRPAAPGRTSGKEQMERFNVVAREAIALGIKTKEHTSSFENYDKGEEKIVELQSKIDAIRAAA